MNKFMKGLALGSCLVAVVACKGKNPLEGQDKKQVANFLVEASIYAETKLKVPGAEALKGKVYGGCMQNHLKKIDCNKFYQTMVDYSKEKNIYSGLSKDNLDNQEFFNSIKKEYDFKTFYTI